VKGAHRLLAFDPGETTGWSVWEFSDRQPLTHIAHGMQRGGVQGVIDFWRALPDEHLPTVVVSESFVIDGRTEFPNVEPLRVEGALAALWNGPLFLQRNTFKRHGPDELLDEHGWYWDGAGHDRDSARHAIAFVLTQKHMPSWYLLRPPPAR
jgi:hypothetical protein